MLILYYLDANKYKLNAIPRHCYNEVDGKIPFLRDQKEKYTLGRRAMRLYKKHRAKSLAHRKMRKELNWHQAGFPISMHNEMNHFSKKLKFEDI